MTIVAKCNSPLKAMGPQRSLPSLELLKILKQSEVCAVLWRVRCVHAFVYTAPARALPSATVRGTGLDFDSGVESRCDFVGSAWALFSLPLGALGSSSPRVPAG